MEISIKEARQKALKIMADAEESRSEVVSMSRDIKAIKELLRSVEALASDAKILAVDGVSVSEQIQWQSSMMSFGHLIESLGWVLRNTETAIASEAAEAKRQADNAEFWRQSDERIRAKQAVEQLSESKRG